jgi:tRNA(Ile)-lysidine synthetase-like protein
MIPFELKIANFINQNELIAKGDSVLVGVSGGPDSLALLHYLIEHQKKYSISVFAAHVDHMLRGEESYQDLLFVQEFCNSYGIPLFATRINIAKERVKLKKGEEETARLFRYEFYQKVMEQNKMNKLALGHHGDDQIETILMKLTRGSSGKGRAGIPIKRVFHSGELVRPLLCLTKSEIEDYCQFYKLNPRHDASNSKLDFTRNRFRLKVLPFLKKENPHIHEHFQRFSEQLTEDETFLQELTLKEMNKVWNKNRSEISLNIPAFLAMPIPLQRRGIHLILNYLYKSKTSSLNALHTDAIFRLLSSNQPSGALDLPLGLKVRRSYQKCFFSFYKDEISSDFYYELYENEEAELPNGCKIKLFSSSGSKPPEGETICLSKKDVELPIIIRNRRDGDRLKVKGLNGTKKVKDIFINEKVPVKERLFWPIVTDQTGKVLWVPELRKSSFDKLPEANHDYYYIQYCKQSSSRGKTKE